MITASLMMVAEALILEGPSEDYFGADERGSTSTESKDQHQPSDEFFILGGNNGDS